MVHARGAAAHGHFQVYKPLARLTKPPLNHSMPADGKPKDFKPRRPKKSLEASAALSTANTVKDTAKSRRVAIRRTASRGRREAMKRALTMGGDGAVGKVGAEFIKAIARHRAWSRESAGQRVPV